MEMELHETRVVHGRVGKALRRMNLPVDFTFETWDAMHPEDNNGAEAPTRVCLRNMQRGDVKQEAVIQHDHADLYAIGPYDSHYEADIREFRLDTSWMRAITKIQAILADI